MPKTPDYSTFPHEKPMTHLRILKTCKRKIVVDREYYNIRYINNSLLPKWSKIPGQCTIGQSKKDGKRRLLVVYERLI
jgi:hypothetical protein